MAGAQAQRAPDIRYSDVARYVGLSLMKDPPRPKSQVRLHPLKAQEMAVAQAVMLPAPGSKDEQVERMKTQLTWLRAQQKAEKEELRRLETCLSDSMLLEKKVQKKTTKDREKFEFHQKHAAQVGDQIQAIQEAIQEASRKPEPPPAVASPAAQPALPLEPSGRSNLPQGPAEEAPAGRSQTAPEQKRVEVVEEEPEVAEDSHLTLKEYFDAADQRQKEKDAKHSHAHLMSASARSQGSSLRSTFRGTQSGQSWRPRPQLSPEEIAQNNDLYRRAIRQLLIDKAGGPKEAFKQMDLNGSGHISLQEFVDGVARMGINWQEMTGMHRPRELFKIFDLDKDGVIVFTELFPDVEEKEPERVTTPDFWKRWVRRNRDLENTRDPKWQPQTPEAELEQLFNTSESHESAEELRKWMAATIRRLKNRGKSDARCREIVAAHLPRGTGPKDREDVQTFSSAEVKLCKKTYNDEVNDPVRNIQKVVYDMREQRRVLHDSRQKLWTVTMEPVMRRQLEEDRKSAAVAVGLSLGGLAGGGIGKGGGGGGESKETPEPPAQAKKSLKIIAQQCKMDEDTVEFLHKEFAAQADKSEMILKKGFQRLLKSLCPGRTISESDANYWWEQASRSMPAVEDTRKAQACDFERFAMWYATSEARTV